MIDKQQEKEALARYNALRTARDVLLDATHNFGHPDDEMEKNAFWDYMPEEFSSDTEYSDLYFDSLKALVKELVERIEDTKPQNEYAYTLGLREEEGEQ